MSEHLPVGWLDVPASSLFSFITSGSRGWAKYYSESGAKFIRVQNVRRGRIDLDLDDVQYVSPPQSAEGLRTKLQAGDLAITITADLGRVGVVPPDLGAAFVNQHVALARPYLPEMAPYLAWFVSSPDAQAQLGLLDRGMTRSGLGLADIGAIRIPFPPRAEQRRIVARIEALFARTRRARADLERVAPLATLFRRRVLDKALGQGRDDGWPNLTLDDLALETRNGISAKPSDEPPGTPILRISAVRPGRVNLGDRRYHRPAQTDDIRPYKLRDGDLLFVRFNGNPDFVAVCGMVRGLEGECVYPDKLIRMRLDPLKASPDYIELAAASGIVRDQLANHIKTAAGQHGISGADLRTIRFPTPSLEVQDSVTSTVRAARTAAQVADHNAARALALLERLESSILARAFRGELIPQDPADEPAEIAVARIMDQSPATGAKRGRPRAGPAQPADHPPTIRGKSMPKSRADSDVKGQPYLTGCLRRLPSAVSADDLYRAADLSIADFYKQLSDEMARGWIKDASGKLVASR